MRLRTAGLFVLLMLFEREASAQNVTFNNQIMLLLQHDCKTCNRPCNIAPFSLLTYQETRLHASQIRTAVESGIMPPWKPVNAHGLFEGERSLTTEEIQTISQWVSDGAPEGNPNDLPEPISF